MKKRLLSLFLAIIMVVGMIPTTVFTAFATEGEGETTPVEQPTTPPESGTALGELSVTIKNVIMTRETEFNVTLTEIVNEEPAPVAEGEGEDATEPEPANVAKVYTTTFTSAAGAESANGFIVDGIKEGKYTLTIQAKGYATYTQELDFTGEYADKRAEIILYNSLSINEGRDAEKDGLFGVIPYGDVNGDGFVDKADSAVIVRIMNGASYVDDKELTAEQNTINKKVTTADCNLNGYKDDANNNVVDLEDLTICVRNQGDCVKAQVFHTESALKLLQEANIQAEVEEGTTVKVTSATGSETGLTMEQALLSPAADSFVALAPANDEDLSDQNPVEFSLNIGSSTDTTEPTDPIDPDNPDKPEPPKEAEVKSEAIVIRPPAGSDNKITAGTLVVIGTDDDGNEVEIEASLAATPTAESGAESQQAGPQRMLKAAARTMAAANTQTTRDAEPAKEQAEGTTTENDGTIVINLGKQVAIKKVTIKVTGSTNGKLADIAKVEFLSDFDKRIPEPQLSIPTVKTVTNTEADGLGYRSVTVTWDHQDNVTGYEVSISGPGYNKTMTSTTTSATFVGDSFNGTVEAYNIYSVKVRSTNGDWKSPWSGVYTLTVTTTKKPNRPEYLSATSDLGGLKISWRKLWDTQSWILYWKAIDEKEAEEHAKYNTEQMLKDNGYTAVPVESPSHPLDVPGAAQYIDFCVVGCNTNGNSPVSNHAAAWTMANEVAIMPQYKMINTKTDKGFYDNHIKSIVVSDYGDQCCIVSDKNNGTGAAGWDPNALIDNNPETYNKRLHWNNGVITVNLDSKIPMNRIRIAYKFPGNPIFYGPGYTTIDYVDENKATQRVGYSLSQKSDSRGKTYVEITLSECVTTDSISVHLVAYNLLWGGPLELQEVRLYYYDSLEDDVANLFADNMRTVLKDYVTKEMIEELITRANTQDPVSKEYHPSRSSLLSDLNYALQLCVLGKNLDPIIKIDNTITTKADTAQGFAQPLSDYQPLGYVAAAGDTVVIYVSRPNLQRGDNANLYLIATQYHPEVSAWQRSVVRLKAGRNEVQIPSIVTRTEERGGSLYIQYTGNKGGEDYSVRVSGATKIPMLNVKDVAKEDRRALIETYVQELKTHVNGHGDDEKDLAGKHAALHDASDNVNVKFTYNVKSCFLNSTEISMNNMFYSLPATEILSGLGGANADNATLADNLEAAIEAMEQEIDYFYQFKGLHKNAPADSVDRYPMQRLNIRYHRMFTGAFMYAGGKHIGIEFGSAADLAKVTPVTVDPETGKTTQEGKWGGWGIAHEIGHCINTSGYVRQEVTNNIFAQLEKAVTKVNGETSGYFRTTYDPTVYRGVASGTVGHTGNLAVQLAMYWQIHLAYDDEYAGKLYESAEDAQANLIYAKIDAIYRDNSKASKTLPAGGDSDQKFMRIVCAAAEKNLLHFFRAWGFTPDATTIAYAEQYDEETRLIQYIDDDSRLYRMNGNPGMSTGTKVEAKIQGVSNRRIKNTSKVEIEITDTNMNSGAILGYEIKRDGKVVAFVTKDTKNEKTTYTDVVTTENNKAFVYTVTAVDRLMVASEALDLPEVKVQKGTEIDKTNWTITTTMTSVTDSLSETGNDNPEPETISQVGALIDGEEGTIYYGTGTSAQRPSVTINLGAVEQVAALKFTPIPLASGKEYTNPADKPFGGLTYTGANNTNLTNYRPFNYTIEVSMDGTSWTTVKAGEIYVEKNGVKVSASNPNSWNPADDVVFGGEDGKSQNDQSITLYFNKVKADGSKDPFMYTYDAAFIRFTSTTMSAMGLAEIDLLGPTSDNVELDDIGTLEDDFHYGNREEDVIPAGSYIFKGTYTGDPSYSVIELRDQNKVILGGEQLIFAEVPKKGELGNVTTGTWIYWMAPGAQDEDGNIYQNQLADNKVTSIQAELYRVGDAFTLADERMTSNSLHEAITEEVLGRPIVITQDNLKENEGDNAGNEEETPANAIVPSQEQQQRLLANEVESQSAPLATSTFGLQSTRKAAAGRNAVSVLAEGDNDGDNGATVPTEPSHEIKNFDYTIEASETDPRLSAVKAPMKFTLSPVNAENAMQAIVTFDANVLTAETEVKFADGLREGLYVNSFVDAHNNQVKLYVIAKTGTLRNTGSVTGTITLAEVENRNDVSVSATINEVDTKNELARALDGSLIPAYESVTFIEYAHTMVQVGDTNATCIAEGEDVYRCIHEDKHIYEETVTEPMVAHAYVIDSKGLVSCEVCGHLLGSDGEAELWIQTGEWYLKGEKVNDGIVHEDGQYRLYEKGKLVKDVGLYKVEDDIVMRGEEAVQTYYLVYVLNKNGDLAVGTTKVPQADSITYTALVDGAAEERTVKLTAKGKYEFTIDGRFVGELAVPKEQRIDALKNALLKAIGKAHKAYTLDEEDVNALNAITVADVQAFKPTKSGSLPAGLTYLRTELDISTTSITIRHLFKATTATVAKKYGLTQESGTTYYLSGGIILLDNVAQFAEPRSKVINSKWTINYSVLSYVYDVLSSSSSIDTEKEKVKLLYQYYKVAVEE